MKNYSLLLVFMATLACGTTPPKDNSDYKNIIGRTIKIHNLEIAEFDFPYKLDWEDAKKSCESLGAGWRLPNEDEFEILKRYRVKVGNFYDDLYWTSFEEDIIIVDLHGGKDSELARYFSFNNQYKKGDPFYGENSSIKENKLWVRAVRNY